VALPSPSVHCSMTCHGLRPRYVSTRSPCRVFRCWLPVHEHLGLVRLWNYFGAQSLHLRLADHPLPSGSTGSVALPCAEFRAGPVVSLWPGWFIQLVYLGFPWRTHVLPVSLFFIFCAVAMIIFPRVKTLYGSHFKELIKQLGVRLDMRCSAGEQTFRTSNGGFAPGVCHPFRPPEQASP